jgi:hypothetical protein
MIFHIINDRPDKVAGLDSSINYGKLNVHEKQAAAF